MLTYDVGHEQRLLTPADASYVDEATVALTAVISDLVDARRVARTVVDLRDALVDVWYKLYT